MWRFASDDVVKVFVWTMRGGVWRFAPDESKRFYLDDAGWCVDVYSGRFRKGCIWTMRGSMCRFASGDFVKYVSGRRVEEGERDGGGGCSGRLRKGVARTVRGCM